MIISDQFYYILSIFICQGGYPQVTIVSLKFPQLSFNSGSSGSGEQNQPRYPEERLGRLYYHKIIGYYIDFTFNGSIDDARVYNRILSAQEVKMLWQMGR